MRLAIHTIDFYLEPFVCQEGAFFIAKTQKLNKYIASALEYSL